MRRELWATAAVGVAAWWVFLRRTGNGVTTVPPEQTFTGFDLVFDNATVGSGTDRRMDDFGTPENPRSPYPGAISDRPPIHLELGGGF
jgi:hypothetical protein